jgi:hypothetical protein
VRLAILLHGLNGKEIRELTQLENKNPHQRGIPWAYDYTPMEYCAGYSLSHPAACRIAFCQP